MDCIYSREKYVNDSYEYDPFITDIDLINENSKKRFIREMTPLNLVDIIDGLYVYMMPEVPFLQLDKDNITNYHALVYQIPEGREIELFCGKLPTEDNEIVVDYNFAQELCNIYQKKTIKDLIGTKVDFYNSMGYEEVGYEDPTWNYKIVGVSSTENIYEYQIFVKDNSYMDSMVENYGIAKEDWYFNEVNFFVDPTSQIDQVESEINNMYKGNESHFEKKLYDEVNWYNLKRVMRNSGNTKELVDTTFFVQSSIVISVLIFILYNLIELISIKRIKKENRLMNRYGYSSLSIGILRKTFYILMTMILCLLLGSMICELMNYIFSIIYKNYEIRSILMNFDLLSIFIIVLVAYIVLIIQEVIINVYTTR